MTLAKNLATQRSDNGRGVPCIVLGTVSKLSQEQSRLCILNPARTTALEKLGQQRGEVLHCDGKDRK